jgi:hypothetical protein
LQFVRAGVSEGISANQAYQNMLSEARSQSELTGERWTGVRRDTFLQMYSGTRVARQNVALALEAPRDQPAGGLSIPTRPSTVASGYLNWGVSFTRPIGGGTVDKNFHPFRTAEPLTPAEVEQLIREQIEESAADLHGSFARQTIEGIAYTGAEQLTQIQAG